MAALLQLAPVQGPSIAAFARLHEAVATTLSQVAERRSALVCRWTPHADARLAFRANVARRRIPIPPH
jgi:hypothetical protein